MQKFFTSFSFDFLLGVAMRNAFFSALAVVFVSVVFMGCEAKPVPVANKPAGTTGHSHDDHGHDHPTNLAEAVKLVTGLKNQIKDAFALKKPDDADHALHEIGHAMESLQSFGAKAAVNPEAKDAVAKAFKDLMDSFDSIHQSMHGGTGGKTYEEVAAPIDAAMAVFESLARSATSPVK
jgi:hypothetical protein